MFGKFNVDQPLMTGTLGIGMNGFWFGFPGHFKFGTPICRDLNGDFRASKGDCL